MLSWASQSDQLAFVYYEQGKFDVYTLDNPRSLRGDPWQPGDQALSAGLVDRTPTPPSADSAAAPDPTGGVAVYRTREGDLRRADSLVVLPDSLRPPGPLSIVALNDSSLLGLPDTSTFTERPYKVRFSPDYVARPTIGYVRDNFGQGVFGGTTVTLSDMLGNRQLVFSGYVNGRIEEASVLAAYANLSRRINWAVGLQQEPYFFYQGSSILPVEDSPENLLITDVRRIVLRSAFGQASYPLSRFRRIEMGLRLTNVDDAILRLNEYFDPFSGLYTRDPEVEKIGLSSTGYVQPSLALVDDHAAQAGEGVGQGVLGGVRARPALGAQPLTYTDTYQQVRGSIGQLNRASSLEELYDVAAREVRMLTGFDRVMVYRFDAEWNGEVIAEERRDDLEPFLGRSGSADPYAR